VIAAILLLQAAAISEPEPPVLTNRCERSALPIECKASYELAVKSSQLLMRCIAGSDKARYVGAKTENGEPVITREMQIEACDDIRNACLMNWRVHYVRLFTRDGRGDQEVHLDEAKRRAEFQCGTFRDLRNYE
jgi:hypothetical protein